MFVFMFFALCLGQMVLEQMIVKAIVEGQRKIPLFSKRTSFDEIHKRWTSINLIFSLGISIMLAGLFPAAGLVVLTSGLVSTALSQSFSKCWFWVAHQQARYAAAKARWRTWWATNRDDYTALARDLWKTAIAIARFVTWPIRKYRAIRAWCASTKARAVATKARFTNRVRTSP